ncbi:probable LRR receptor-like serine/threonine-protein kinase At3g47570 [Camellia sinensis]|uniref:probable LRR receptor-like serine/threonine-protein kinase At3g47570 n=1 Tax=Camellia sinensis TaxID=4442 RepID=UPI001036B079|nr:probable LRR receptor-like serine/threonine-protein kinase At3g47570 [Camellia sinensis]
MFLMFITLIHLRTLPNAAAIFSIFGGNETDHLALLAFKSKIIRDPQGVMNSWSNSLHFCEWEGVSCGHRHRRVTAIDLESSGIEIPANLSHSSSQMFLGLANNDLVGTVPRELSFLSKLKHLVIQKNNLTGGIPSFLVNLTALEVISAAQNAFGGSTPDELGQPRNTSYFALGENNLSGWNSLFGSLPSEVGNLKNLAELDISENKLFGRVPSTVGSCTSLQNLSLEGNFLQGSTPASLSSLRATDGFSSENLIGVGGFGSVYKGILDQDGSVVAVKVFNLQSQGASKSFLAECETLRNIQHRKLIKIITACSTIDFQGEDFKALVYEFMPNGSLK